MSYNKDKMKEYMNEYVKNSQNIKCECGGKYKTYNKYLHVKTNKHKKYKEENITNIQNISKEIEELKKLLQQRPQNS